MKILVSTDIEGVAGVYHAEQTRPGNGEYERARAWMTAEADAAVRGAFAGGATEVLVNDSHGAFRNLLADRLDPRARLVQGKPRYLSMMSGLEEGCDAVCLIGYHSRAQGRGILAHTISSFAFARIWVNDMELGEAGLYGALAGERGVPVIMASGDDVFIDEHRPLFPHVQWVQTKVAHGQGSGVSLSPAASCAAIEAAAQQAVAAHVLIGGATTLAQHDCPQAAPLRLTAPMRCRIQTQGSAFADLFCMWPALTRVDGVTVQFEAPSMGDAIRMINCLSAMSASLR